MDERHIQPRGMEHRHLPPNLRGLYTRNSDNGWPQLYVQIGFSSCLDPQSFRCPGHARYDLPIWNVLIFQQRAELDTRTVKPCLPRTTFVVGNEDIDCSIPSCVLGNQIVNEPVLKRKRNSYKDVMIQAPAVAPIYIPSVTLVKDCEFVSRNQ